MPKSAFEHTAVNIQRLQKLAKGFDGAQIYNRTGYYNKLITIFY